MIEAMSLQRLSELTSGIQQGADVSFSEVSTDSRLISAGALFVALQGPNFDGNSFVDAARVSGAVAALVSKPVVTDLPLVIVPDTRIALGKLAKENRLSSKAVILGLTGSQGKTTVKEMAASILASLGSVHATRGNLNNDIGVPLTLLQLGVVHQFAVIEMGANSAGEIAYTTALVKPDIALINNIAGTHLEGFGSLEGVSKAKSEIWQGLQEQGKAIINLDDSLIPDKVRISRKQTAVGISAAGKFNADYRIANLNDHGLAGTTFTLVTPVGEVQISLPLPGKHNAANALAAAAMAMEAGADMEAVRTGLQSLKSVKGRLVIRKGKHGAVILDDTYNASPASFSAAIDVLRQQSGIRIVVAGEMAELGDEKSTAHSSLGALAMEQGIEYLFGTGELVRLSVKAFGANAAYAENTEELVALVRPYLNAGVTVLVKGSRSAGMERVVKQLILEED